MKNLMFSTKLKAVTLYAWVCYVNSRVYAFYTRLARKQVTYDTRHVQRIVAYTAQCMKMLCRAKIKSFFMNLMFDNGLVNRLKHGVGVKGEGA